MKVSIFKYISFILFLSILSLSSLSINAQNNLAKKKKYSFSEKANYVLTDGFDELDLTDGIKKTGDKFWINTNTVGWKGKKEVVIDLDLEEEFIIESVLINTARNEVAEVRFPLHCFVFTSSNQNEYLYHGDLMQREDNILGGYKVSDFLLDIPNTKGRFVKIVLVPNGKYLFLDELEVFGKKLGADDIGNSKKKPVAVKNINSFLVDESERILDARYQKDMFASATKYLSGFISEELRLKESNKEIIESIQNKFLPKKILFTPIDEYSKLSAFSLKDIVQFHKNNSENEIEIENELTYFSILNNKSNSKLITINEIDNFSFDIYEILPVKAINKADLKDALRLVQNKKIEIKPGENRQFVICVLNHKNNINADLSITCDDNEIGSLKFSIAGIKKSGGDLNVNLWAYLDRPILKDNKKTIINDLENGEMNVIVVHSGFIDGYRTKDFANLKGYLQNFKNLQNKKILLFDNFKNYPERKFGGKKILDTLWKSNFKHWYSLLQEELRNIGVAPKNIYFYPYDEISGSDIDHFIELTNWGKDSIPNFQTFITINDKKSLKVSRYADIVQITKSQISNIGDVQNSNTWVYFADNYSRELDAYKYYRLLSWYAYYYDLKGVGFWNYCALTSIEDARYDSFGNSSSEYSAIYLDSNRNILPSLRWLCFKQGLSDYHKLKMFEELKGKEEVLKMVKEVINNPNDTKQADAVFKKLRGQFNH